jgi:hypothetical protein
MPLRWAFRFERDAQTARAPMRGQPPLLSRCDMQRASLRAKVRPDANRDIDGPAREQDNNGDPIGNAWPVFKLCPLGQNLPGAKAPHAEKE